MEILNVYDVLHREIEAAMAARTRVIIHSKPDWDVEQGGFNIMIPPVVHIYLRDAADAAILLQQKGYCELANEGNYHDIIVTLDAHARMNRDLSRLPGLGGRAWELSPKDFGSGLAARTSSCSSKLSFQDCLEFTAPSMPL